MYWIYTTQCFSPTNRDIFSLNLDHITTELFLTQDDSVSLQITVFKALQNPKKEIMPNLHKQCFHLSI